MPQLLEEKSVELREVPKKTVPAPDVRHLQGKKEAMLNAWRPAGSSSLGERWLKAGAESKAQRSKHSDLLRAAKALSDL
jgi:hypothetical protein